MITISQCICVMYCLRCNNRCAITTQFMCCLLYFTLHVTFAYDAHAIISDGFLKAFSAVRVSSVFNIYKHMFRTWLPLFIIPYLRINLFFATKTLQLVYVESIVLYSWAMCGYNNIKKKYECYR